MHKETYLIVFLSRKMFVIQEFPIMFGLYRWQSPISFLLGLSLTTSAVIPLGISTAQAQTQLFDIQGHWAQRCIRSLAEQNIINGYPDGSFRPNAPVNRAEFATLVGNAFPNVARNRTARSFNDVSSSFWAYNAIRAASQTGFLSGYPDGSFRPTQNIPRAQVLVSLGNGLNYTPAGGVNALLDRTYDDAATIPNYARPTIAAATENQLVVNYPNVRRLRPNQSATRADVAAFLCQALRSPQQTALISAEYIAGVGVAGVGLAAGTEIPVTYEDADRIIVSPKETVDLALSVPRDVTNTRGQVVIPQGSEVRGQLQPSGEGSQFIAREVVIADQVIPIQARSGVFTQTRSTRDPNLISLARNAAIGAGAAAGISAVVGDRTITAERVLTGAALGTAIETNQGRPAASIVRDTAIGAAAAAGISAVVGDRTITPEKVLAGATSGATIGGVIDPAVKRVVIIDPDTDFGLTLDRAWEPLL